MKISASRTNSLLSEKVLSIDWNKPEEDLAWAKLPKRKSILKKVISIFKS